MLGKTGMAEYSSIQKLRGRGLLAYSAALLISLTNWSPAYADEQSRSEAVPEQTAPKSLESGKEACVPPEKAETAPEKSSATLNEQTPESKDTASSELPRKKRRKTELADVLPCLTWIDPEVEQKAALLCVHGLGLHNDCYEAFGKRMAKLGYIVYAVDMPGFGSFKQAEGRDRVDFDYCKRGLKDTLRLIRKVNPGMPVFILGESMGGAIALRVTSEFPDLVDGLISCVPSGDRFEQSKEAIKVGIKLLTSPNKEFNIGSSVIERATQKDDVRKSWSEDILNRMNLTPKELLHFQDFMNENRDSAKKITNTPVLFVQGCKDKLVRPEGTMELYNAISCPDRDLKLIRDGEHLIFELGQFDDQVITMVDEWLAAHIDKKKQLGSR